MTDLDRALLEAWAKVKPKLDADPDELRRRLARRRRPSLMRPPRAWCIAVRACDQRINPGTAAITPEWAVELPNPISTRYRQPHTVTLTKPLLQRLCAVVRITPPHEDWRRVAESLGVRPGNLYHARRTGRLRVEHYPGEFGRFGRPVPMLFTWDLLDPTAPLYQRPDAVWGTLWQSLANFLPDDFEQTLERAPRQERSAAAARAGALDREEFRGWQWVCPGCRRHVRKVFHPISPVNFPEVLGIDPIKDDASADARPQMPPCFACADCHGVGSFSRLNTNAWNELVGYLSAGLLYGREVAKPAWFTPQRKRAYAPMPGRAPSRRIEEVRERLLRGWDFARIALDLRVGVGTVSTYAVRIYKHHRVHSRAAFLRAAGVPLPEELTRNERLLELLCAGRSNGEIARELGITRRSVENRVTQMYRAHRVSGREELMMKHRHGSRYATRAAGATGLGVGKEKTAAQPLPAAA